MATSGILTSTPLTPIPSHMVITSPPRESDALPSQACIASIISCGVEPPSPTPFAVRLPKSAGPICHIQKPYTSVHGPNTGSPPAASCSHYFEILFSRGLGSFVRSSIFGSFYHAATNYVVETSKVKQRDHTEKAHGDHLLEPFGN